MLELLYFRLLSELYSLLFKNLESKELRFVLRFPSPLGVIFSLINGGGNYEKYDIFKKISVSSRSYILSYLH